VHGLDDAFCAVALDANSGRAAQTIRAIFIIDSLTFSLSTPVVFRCGPSFLDSPTAGKRMFELDQGRAAAL